jgi:hypothetical protein
MADAVKAFKELHLDEATQQEIYGILSTYQSSCVLAPGEVAPADPGPSRPTGAASSLYHRLGGVYPIAQFVDRLVDRVLRGDRVHVAHDRLDDPAGRRHPPGLKYMLTELVCHGTGGPEVVTSKGFDEAKLGVQVEDWPKFLELAAEAAAVWPIPHLRNSLVSALGALKAEICIGVVDEDTSAEARARRKVQEAGFDHYLSSSALEKCGGDAAQALELLARGWTPEGQVPGSMGSLPASFPGFEHDAPKCPFARPGVAPPPGHPPVQARQSMKPTALQNFKSWLTRWSCYTAPVVEEEECLEVSVGTASDDHRASAVRTLAEKGMKPSHIASLLSMDEADVAAVLATRGCADTIPGQGRMLGSDLQKRLDDLLEENSELCCPVSLVLFVEPVIASDGFMYEKGSLEGLLRANMVSPLTREPLKKEYLPAKQRQAAALEFRQARSKELIRFAEEAAPVQPQMASAALERAGDYLEVLKPAAVPGLAKRAAALWKRLGQRVPTSLVGF